MATARSLFVDPEATGFYHCISRCVRRTWLCGIDPYNRKSYEHRREWVEGRPLELAEVFALSIYADAVMSNHVHVVLRIDPETAATWTSEEVAARWVRLFPTTVNGEVDPLETISETIRAKQSEHPQIRNFPTRFVSDFLHTRPASSSTLAI